MNPNLEFLKERLAMIETRISITEDYKEMQVLRRLIEEYSKKSVARSTIKPNVVRKKIKPYTKNMANSPVPNLPRGQRIVTMYNLCEEIAKKHNGEIEFGQLTKILKNDYSMTWKDLSKKGNLKNGRIATYIKEYNKRNPNDQRLTLFPIKAPGQQRVHRFTKIISIAREKGKLANAI